ncbi:unnamed protein product, partial [Amoebophrya sp. A25]
EFATAFAKQIEEAQRHQEEQDRAFEERTKAAQAEALQQRVDLNEEWTKRLDRTLLELDLAHKSYQELQTAVATQGSRDKAQRAEKVLQQDGQIAAREADILQRTMD